MTVEEEKAEMEVKTPQKTVASGAKCKTTVWHLKQRHVDISALKRLMLMDMCDLGHREVAGLDVS